MINSLTEEQPKENEKNTVPDDLSGMHIRGFLKIVDPESGEVILETAN